LIKNSHQFSGARVNPIIIVVAAVVAVLALLLVINPPQVVDGPTSPPTSPPVVDEETSNDETTDSDNNNTTDNQNGTTDTSNSQDTQEMSTAECATDPDEQRDGVWRAQMDSDTQAILEQIISSHGGLEKLISLCTIHGVGESTLSTQGQTVDSEVELWLRIPNQVRNLVKVPLPVPGQFIETLIVWEGSIGWTKAPNPQTFQVEVTELPGELKVQAIEEIELHPVLSLLSVQDAGASFTYVGTDHEANEGAHAIEFRTELGSTGTFFYDPETFQTVSLLRQGGGRTVMKQYENYKSVSGFTVPHTIVTHLEDPQVGQLDTTLSYESISINSELDPALFEKPESN